MALYSGAALETDNQSIRNVNVLELPVIASVNPPGKTWGGKLELPGGINVSSGQTFTLRIPNHSDGTIEVTNSDGCFVTFKGHGPVPQQPPLVRKKATRKVSKKPSVRLAKGERAKRSEKRATTRR